MIRTRASSGLAARRCLGLLAAPLLMLACESTRPANTVKLERDEYPVIVGKESSAIEVASFVKQRTDLVFKLWNESRYDDAVSVLEDLHRYVPSSVRTRFDLGMLYFNRAQPHIVQARKLSNDITELSNRGETERAEDLQAELALVYRDMEKDCRGALEQFQIYSQRTPQDPRPVDVMWKCYMALELYPEALQALGRMIDWDEALDDQQRADYRVIQRRLRDYVMSSRSTPGELEIPGGMNPSREPSSKQ
jgi:tetratricopeptide (TPR) repeat protein